MTPSHGSSIGVAKAPKTLSFAGAALAALLRTATRATTRVRSTPVASLERALLLQWCVMDPPCARLSPVPGESAFAAAVSTAGRGPRNGDED